MHANVLVLLALAVAGAAAVSDLPSTPSIETEKENMLLRVGGDKSIKFQFGPNSDDSVDVKDPHEPTISALALGYSIGAQLDNLKCNDNLETKLRGELHKVEDEVSKRVDQLDAVTDKLDKLSAANSDALSGMQAIVDKAVEDLKDVVKGGPSSGGSGGGGSAGALAAASWNPIPDVLVEDTRASSFVFTWPVTSSGGPLIVHSEADLYTVKFTALNADGSESDETRTVGPLKALTPRLLALTLPAWHASKNTLPKSSHFDANIKVYEQGRPMANPTENVVKVQATAPRTNAPKTFAVSGSQNKAKTFTLGLVLDYPYPEQWDDVVVAAAGTHSRVGSVSVSGTGKKRSLSFSVTASDDFSFEIRLTSQSKSSGQKTVQVIAVSWRKSSLEKDNPVLSDTQTQQILARASGLDREWTLCFNAAVHGWNTRTMHTKCTKTGRKILYIARRGDNKRVYGAYLYNGASRGAGYYQSGESRNFIYRAVSPTSNVEFATNIGKHGRHGFYINDDYAYTNGGGHDLYCNVNFQSCYSNFDHGWWTPALGGHCYQQSNCKNWVTGSYNWNLNGNSGSSYKVYYSTN